MRIINGQRRKMSIAISKLNSIITVMVIFLSACVSRPTFSQDITPDGLYYYDGSQKIILEIEPGLIAEFGNPQANPGRQSKSLIQKSESTAELVRSRGQVNFWKTQNKDGSVAFSKSLLQTDSIAYSPVFKTVKGSSLLALPGNIIVELDSSMNQKQAEAFFGSKGLRIFRKLDLAGRNYFEVETPAGAASLNLANSLYGQSGVISSTPNWWREVVAK